MGHGGSPEPGSLSREPLQVLVGLWMEMPMCGVASRLQGHILAMCTWYAASERGEPSGTEAAFPPGNRTVTSAIMAGVEVRGSEADGFAGASATNATACARATKKQVNLIGRDDRCRPLVLGAGPIK
jgi:hypothetical protein